MEYQCQTTLRTISVLRSITDRSSPTTMLSAGWRISIQKMTLKSGTNRSANSTFNPKSSIPRKRCTRSGPTQTESGTTLLIETVTFTDHNNVEKTETLHFHINEVVLMENITM